VCAEVIGAIEKNKFEVILPRWLAFFCALQRLAPSLFRAIAHRRFRRYVGRASPSQDQATMTGTNGG
jgi:hypothetical protein